MPTTKKGGGDMGFLQTSRTAMTMLLILGLGSLSQGAEKDQKIPDKGVMHTIDARVTYSAGTSAGTNVLAERQPGHFTVRPGQVARDFKFSFVDPKSGIERDKLNDHTIYCETTKQWVKIPADPATLELPPGDYKFVVGGQPGASGTLNFRTFTRDGSTPPPDGGGNTKPPIGNPPIRKPPPPSDTTKNDVKRDRLHPSGEGTRKVTIHSKVTQVNKELPTPMVSEGDVTALLSIKGDAFVLEYQLPNAEGVSYDGKWEGTVERKGTSISVAGKTYVSVTIQMKPSGTTLDKATGTFTGKLAGNRLSGTATEEGTTTYSYNPLVRSFRRTHEWYIDDFAK